MIMKMIMIMTMMIMMMMIISEEEEWIRRFDHSTRILPIMNIYKFTIIDN